MQWAIMESCEESAPGYSANFSGSTNCDQSSLGSVVRFWYALEHTWCSFLVHVPGTHGGQKWNVWNLKLDIHHVLVTGVLDRVVG